MAVPQKEGENLLSANDVGWIILITRKKSPSGKTIDCCSASCQFWIELRQASKSLYPDSLALLSKLFVKKGGIFT